MACDIYGNRLERGHCEVHPHVHEEYPCSVCLYEHQQHVNQQRDYDQQCEQEANDHYADRYHEHLLDGGVGLA